jgi:rhodanese-related sulfurtransferase
MVVVTASAAIAAGYNNILSPDAKRLIDAGTVYLLDVRTPEEFQQGHLKGAVLIPIDQLKMRLGEIPRNRKIVVYCAVGPRSNAAARLLAEKGYRDVYTMQDGIVGWYRNGLPLSR